MTKHPYERFLDRVHSPAQYVGNEVHSVVHPKSPVRCRIALCFPELYSIGMSHLGLKILYSIANNSPDLAAERFFTPEPDMEQLLRETGELLRSLESHDPLGEFDIVGFSIPTELCFTGILTMLDLGGIPLKRADRDETHPLIVGGGASVFNPEPVADFFDIFIMGDAEEALPATARAYAACKREGLPKNETLRRLARIEGVCVPSLFTVEYDGVKIQSITPAAPDIKKPRRAILDDLGKSPFPYDMVIPYGQPVFDRLSVEIDRGCTGGCRYCQAGMTYRPVRERKADDIIGIIERGVRETGFDDVTLASLTSGDYSSIEQLVTMVMDKTEDARVAVSLPSLRSGTLSDNLIKQISRVRKTGFTITAEAGSERLRRVINKKITDDEIVETARKVLANGWRVLKLYFMIGLPTETDEDVEGIVRLVEKINYMKENGKRFQTINVGVSQFVPKAHTPFQWVAMDRPEELLRKKEMVYEGFRRMRAVKLKGHEVEMSYMEGVFSRGDRRLAEVVLNAYRKGCRLDGWSEHFRFDLWREAFADAGLDADNFALRARDKDEALPWDYLDIGVAKKFLLRDLKDAEKEIESPDCRYGVCQGCGLPADDNIIQNPAEHPAPRQRARREETNTAGRYRISFRKEGPARFISHLDMVTAFGRAFRRAGLPVAYSQGFHPHQRMSFGSALPVGVVSLAESLDVEMATPAEPSEIMEKLNRQLERGLTIYSVALMTPPYRSIQSAAAFIVWEITDTGEMSPPLADARAALDKMDGMLSTIITESAGQKTLRFEYLLDGALTKLKKQVPGFALSADRRLTKVAVIMKPSPRG